MYPLTSYSILKILDQERIEHAACVHEQGSLAQLYHPATRSLALTVGHALIALGNHLEHYGQ
jgi:hypothetical protein